MMKTEIIMRINGVQIPSEVCSPNDHCVSLTSGYGDVVQYAADSLSSWDNFTWTAAHTVHIYVDTWKELFHVIGFGGGVQ